MKMNMVLFFLLKIIKNSCLVIKFLFLLSNYNVELISLELIHFISTRIVLH